MEIIFTNANNDIPNWITAISSLILVGVAVFGFNQWKKQLKGKTDYEIARRYLRASLQLRDAMRFVRRPYISPNEQYSALLANGLESSDNSNRDLTNRAVYSIRWKKVIEARTNLEAEMIEAEISWGEKAIEVQKNLFGLSLKLDQALYSCLNGQTKGKDRIGEIIYEGVDDKFGQEVGIAIQEIKDYLRPHLK